MKIDISQEEIDAAYAVICKFMTGPNLPVTKVLAVDVLKDALRIRKARKKARKRLESEHEGEQWGACV